MLNESRLEVGDIVRVRFADKETGDGYSFPGRIVAFSHHGMVDVKAIAHATDVFETSSSGYYHSKQVELIISRPDKMQNRLEDAESALRLYREAGHIPEYLDPATKYFNKYGVLEK